VQGEAPFDGIVFGMGPTGGLMMAAKVFLCYRRDDSAGYAGRFRAFGTLCQTNHLGA
jgi:hypothetical protein